MTERDYKMFIRTKDNVYEIESDYLNNKGVRVGYNVVGQEEVVLIENNNVIQSDTIAELCDEFVYVTILDNHYEYHKDYLKCLLDVKKDKYNIVYGAIWTDKGLIYVAKMNDKGELELI